MKIVIKNYEPYIKAFINNESSNNISINCLVDTWFWWVVAMPYFSWKNEEKSIVNFIDFLDEPKLQSESRFIETASWISKTYTSNIALDFWLLKTNSPVFLYKHNLEYSTKRDWLILWMKFIEENNLELLIKSEDWKFSKYYLN